MVLCTRKTSLSAKNMVNIIHFPVMRMRFLTTYAVFGKESSNFKLFDSTVGNSERVEVRVSNTDN